MGVADSPAAKTQDVIAYLAGRWWFWAVMIAIPFSWPFVFSLKQDVPPPLMTYGDVPEFELVNRYGEPFSSEWLDGKMWAGAFVATRCETPCDTIMGMMQEIQHRSRHMGPVFHMVTFTVDPEFDTVPKLSEYAKRFKASGTGWSFVTGDNRSVERAAIEGLKVAFGRRSRAGQGGEVLSPYIILVDQQGRIRGYYDSSRHGAVDQLLRDAAVAFEHAK